jgi:hypothetical protein
LLGERPASFSFEFLGFYSIAVEVFVCLGCGTVTSQKNRDLFSAASKFLTLVFNVSTRSLQCDGR